MAVSLSAFAVPGLPEVREGTDLAAEIAAKAELRDGDIVAIAQKVVSKAEGRTSRLGEVRPSPRARELAVTLGKDPALVELILGESRRIVRAERGVLIVETTGGHVCANAGIDSSNAGGDGDVVLLPADADRSARELRAALAERTGVRTAVLVTDSFGRPWRLGQSEVAIGCAGLAPLADWRGRPDRDGRELAATAIAVADQAAACADLVRDKASGEPVAVVRGLARHVGAADGPGARALVRASEQDLFR